MFRLISIFLAGTIWFPEIKADEIRLDFTQKKVEMSNYFKKGKFRIYGRRYQIIWEISQKFVEMSK